LRRMLQYMKEDLILVDTDNCRVVSLFAQARNAIAAGRVVLPAIRSSYSSAGADSSVPGTSGRNWGGHWTDIAPGTLLRLSAEGRGDVAAGWAGSAGGFFASV